MAPRRKTAQSRTPLIIGATVLVLALVGAGLFHWKTTADRAAATIRAQQQWAGIRQIIVTRLHQTAPSTRGGSAAWSMARAVSVA